MPNDPFVDVAALTSLGSIQYLDARDQAMFDAGHAPGAVNVPVEEWDKAAKAADIGFAKTAYWDQALRSLGVDPLATAVAYDDGRMTNAARVGSPPHTSGLTAAILKAAGRRFPPRRCRQVPSPQQAVPAVPGAGSGVWSIGRSSASNLVARRTYSTAGRALSSPGDMRNRTRAAASSGARHSRMPISRMALFARRRSASDDGTRGIRPEAITSSSIAKGAGGPH